MNEIEDKPRWRVMYVHPRSEKKVAAYCRISNVSFYLPLRMETRVYQRRKVQVEKPVFPGYVFASLNVEKRETVMKSNHILRIIHPSNQRLLLHQLAQIRKALRANPTLIAIPSIEKGTTVRITRGPFMGIEGIVSSKKGSSRVILNVNMVKQAVVIEVEHDCLEIID